MSKKRPLNGPEFICLQSVVVLHRVDTVKKLDAPLDVFEFLAHAVSEADPGDLPRRNESDLAGRGEGERQCSVALCQGELQVRESYQRRQRVEAARWVAEWQLRPGSESLKNRGSI
jgi:hypothetical protein